MHPVSMSAAPISSASASMFGYCVQNPFMPASTGRPSWVLHPALTPPGAAAASKSSTCAPARAKARAAPNPAQPAPITTAFGRARPSCDGSTSPPPAHVREPRFLPRRRPLDTSHAMLRDVAHASISFRCDVERIRGSYVLLSMLVARDVEAQDRFHHVQIHTRALDVASETHETNEVESNRVKDLPAMRMGTISTARFQRHCDPIPPMSVWIEVPPDPGDAPSPCLCLTPSTLSLGGRGGFPRGCQHMGVEVGDIQTSPILLPLPGRSEEVWIPPLQSASSAVGHPKKARPYCIRRLGGVPAAADRAGRPGEA